MGGTKERLMDLQRTVDTLQGRVQEMQRELRQEKRPAAERWWRHLLGARHSEAFMSACCNRRARPNTKVMEYARTRSEH